MALDGRIDAIVTAPLNKEAMQLAGHKFDGHTGLLGHLCGATNYFMLLGSPRLRAIHVSNAPLAARGRAAGHARARTGGDPGGA